MQWQSLGHSIESLQHWGPDCRIKERVAELYKQILIFNNQLPFSSMSGFIYNDWLFSKIIITLSNSRLYDCKTSVVPNSRVRYDLVFQSWKENNHCGKKNWHWWSLEFMTSSHTWDLECGMSCNFPPTSRALFGFEWWNLVFIIASHKKITSNKSFLTTTTPHEAEPRPGRD